MNNNNNKGNGSFNGFLLGILIGGGLALLVATKKGRQLLKTISEEGFEGISGLEDFLSEVDDEYEEPKQHHASSDDHSEHAEDEYITEPVTRLSSPRRFFRGIPRRHN